MNESTQPEHPNSLHHLPVLEVACWSALIMAPLIYWLQGPSVSTDQYIMRSALVIVALIGGISMRIAAIARQRRLRAQQRNEKTTTQSPQSR